VGIDDKTKDKRAWRETVTRTRFKDDMIVEYDRELHRHTMLFPDGTKYTRWLQDDRVEREKAADSDKTGVPPRHFQKHEWPDGYSYEYMWDEDAKLHYRKEIMADGTIIEFQYNENGEPHKHRFSYSDGGLFEYNLITHTLTIKADKVNISPVTQNQTGVNVSGTLIDSSGNTPHHSH
jgi:phage baseplate assembly protein gpV